MPLVSCPQCGVDVSSSAFTCPNCGYQLQTPKPIHFSQQSYLQRGLTAPRLVSVYALMLSIIVFTAFPTPYKVYGFALALGLEAIQIARGCYGTGSITLVISGVLAFFGLGL